jgi:hypothetical protein
MVVLHEQLLAPPPDTQLQCVLAMHVTGVEHQPQGVP